jgi:hypothetical protein
MTRMEAGILTDVDIAKVVRDASSQIVKLGFHAVLQINERQAYADMKPPTIKPVGNITVQIRTEILCDCGCRLFTDGSLFWCSGVKCNFIGREETL